jgi:hypothetical protein
MGRGTSRTSMGTSSLVTRISAGQAPMEPSITRARSSYLKRWASNGKSPTGELTFIAPLS